MKPEQQRIKLAEWDGWIRGKWAVGARLQQPGWFNGKHYAWTPTDLPNYPEDLNAVHGLLPKLTDKQQEKCAQLLIQITLETKEKVNTATLIGCFLLASASASQWCEALLKTLGLWED